MRISEKEIKDRIEIDEVIRGCSVCRVAFAINNEPYMVPLSFGYDGAAFYFHTALEGKKIDCIEANRHVCFELERDVRLEGGNNGPCSWSFSYESIMGYGIVTELVTPEDRAKGMNMIMEHYTRKQWQFKPEMLDKTRLWRLEVESVTGKRSGPESSD